MFDMKTLRKKQADNLMIMLVGHALLMLWCKCIMMIREGCTKRVDKYGFFHARGGGGGWGSGSARVANKTIMFSMVLKRAKNGLQLYFLGGIFVFLGKSQNLRDGQRPHFSLSLFCARWWWCDVMWGGKREAPIYSYRHKGCPKLHKPLKTRIHTVVFLHGSHLFKAHGRYLTSWSC